MEASKYCWRRLSSTAGRSRSRAHQTFGTGTHHRCCAAYSFSFKSTLVGLRLSLFFCGRSGEAAWNLGNFFQHEMPDKRPLSAFYCAGRTQVRQRHVRRQNWGHLGIRHAQDQVRSQHCGEANSTIPTHTQHIGLALLGSHPPLRRFFLRALAAPPAWPCAAQRCFTERQPCAPSSACREFPRNEIRFQDQSPDPVADDS